MKHQNLFDNWQACLNHKQAIINNQGAYYYQETIETKHRHRVCGVMVNPTYSYHNETRFDHARYNNDLANIDHQINLCLQAINNVQHAYNAHIANLVVTHNTHVPTYNNLRNEITNLNNQCSANYQVSRQLESLIVQKNTRIDELQTAINNSREIANTNNQLNAQLTTIIARQTTKTHHLQTAVYNLTNQTNTNQQLNAQINNSIEQQNSRSTFLQSEIDSLRNQINANSRSSYQLENLKTTQSVKTIELETQVSNLNTELANNQSSIVRINNLILQENDKAAELQIHIALEAEIKNLRAQLSSENQEIYDQLIEMSAEERSSVIAKFFMEAEFTAQLEIVKKIGFDADYLAYLAIENANSDMLKLAVSSGADCASLAIEGRTILQKAILEGKDELTAQILSSGDFDNALLDAINKNDFTTFDKIISIDNSYLHKTYYGLTLLQIGIYSEKTEIIDKILSSDELCAGKLSSQGRSAFEIALSLPNDEVIKTIAKHSNVSKISQELCKLIEKHEVLSIEKALSALELPIEILQNLLEQAAKHQAETLIEILVTKGADLNLVLEKALANADCDVLQSLIVYEPDFLAIIEQNSDALSSLVGEVNEQITHYVQI